MTEPETSMNWTGCKFVEMVEGRCSGAPTVIGTRVFPESIVHSYASGMSVAEIHDDFPSVPEKTIAALVDFAEASRIQSAA